MDERRRCEWCGSDPLYMDYHDKEWGVQIRDSKDLFAKLILDGAQAGLSWITILRKRENYYRAMDGLDPTKMARWTDKRIEKLLLDEGLVRNRLKMFAARQNARAYLALEEELGSFGNYLWGYADEFRSTNGTHRAGSGDRKYVRRGRAERMAGRSGTGPTGWTGHGQDHGDRGHRDA